MAYANIATSAFSRGLFYTGAIALLASAMHTPAYATPEKMRAIVQVGNGGPEVLQLQTIDVPKPDAGQVLIKIYAAGVNPADWKRRINPSPAAASAATSNAPARPIIPGLDAAGVIEAVGPGVTAWKPGDRVVATLRLGNGGAYAEYALSNATDVAPKPKSFTYEQTAGMPVAGVAGYRAVVQADVKKGQHVAIVGAAGGVGSTAVQFAKARGAYVIASAHSSQNEYLKSLGVDEIVDYDKDNVADKIKNADAVLNLVDGQADTAIGYVKTGGVLVSTAGPATAAKCAAAGVTCFGGFGLDYKGPTSGETLTEMGRLADAGQYKLVVEKVFPLEQAGAAQEMNRTGNSQGKIIIAVAPQSNQR